MTNEVSLLSDTVCNLIRRLSVLKKCLYHWTFTCECFYGHGIIVLSALWQDRIFAVLRSWLMKFISWIFLKLVFSLVRRALSILVNVKLVNTLIIIEKKVSSQTKRTQYNNIIFKVNTSYWAISFYIPKWPELICYHWSKNFWWVCHLPGFK